MSICLAVDGMGGDYGASVTVPATEAFLRLYPDVHIILVGKPEVLAGDVARLAKTFGDRIRLQAASEVVDMDEPPAAALKKKKDSSMRVAINLVKDGVAQAAVSAGNTGALMATAKFVLKTLPGIDRPALCSVMPGRAGRTYVLDLGANVDCTAENLLQFGIMGSMLVAALEQIERPIVGLLNIGSEDIKGNEVVKEAAELLRQSELNFVGNVEGDQIYSGEVDVVVCDGFVGNVALKASEGLAQMIAKMLREEFSRGLLGRLSGLFALPVLKRFKQRVDHRPYNGAALLGLRGVVVKSHGSADAFAFRSAMVRAAEAARQSVVAKINEKFAEESGSHHEPSDHQQSSA